MDEQMRCLIAHDDSEGLAFWNLVHNLHSTLCIRAAKALASLPTYMHRLTWAFIAQHRHKYQNQMGLFLWSVLSLLVNLFCLIWTMQRIIRLQFYTNDNVHIWHAKYQFDIICNKFHCKINESNWLNNAKQIIY